MNDQLVNGSTEQRPPSKVSAAQLVNGASKGSQQEQNNPAASLDAIAAATQAMFLPVMTIETALNRRSAIEDLKKLVMVPDQDFGIIPGSTKPTLLKPGAEKLTNHFGFAPAHEFVERIEDWSGADHEGEPLFYYLIRCRLTKNGQLVGEGLGSCNSWESKYRWRAGERKCPSCGAAAIIKGKTEYGGGWLCFGKKGGCGAKFPDGSQAIESQQTGRVLNPDLFDQVNTFLKMAKKRAHIDAILNATGASEFFTQDAEDLPSDPRGYSIDTGNAPHGTKEAADNVRDRKLAAIRAEQAQPKPAATETAVEKPWRSVGGMKECFRAVRERVGETVYFAVLQRHGVEGPEHFRKTELALKCWAELDSIAKSEAA